MRLPVDLQQPVLDGDRTEADAHGHPLAAGGQRAPSYSLGVSAVHGSTGSRHRLTGGDIDVQLGHGHPALRLGVHAQGALAGAMVVRSSARRSPRRSPPAGAAA